MNGMKKLIKLPTIYNAGGDLEKQWFIEFYVRNPRNNKFERLRKKKGINGLHTFKERMNAAKKMKHYWTDKLKAGWTPYIDQSIIYADNLEFQTAITNYRVSKSHNGTFRYYGSKYIDTISNNIEETTMSTYRSKMRLFDAWLDGMDLADVDVSALNQKILYKFFLFLIEDRKLSKVSVVHYKQIIANVFRYVQKERKQYINPCYDLPETKRINDKTPQPIQEHDIQEFKQKIKVEDPQLWMAIEFEYYCFLRPGKELRLLKIGDIDFARGTVRVRAINAKTVERRVAIPWVFLTAIREEYGLQNYPRGYYVIGKDGKPGATHFVNLQPNLDRLV